MMKLYNPLSKQVTKLCNGKQVTKLCNGLGFFNRNHDSKKKLLLAADNLLENYEFASRKLEEIDQQSIIFAKQYINSKRDSIENNNNITINNTASVNKPIHLSNNRYNVPIYHYHNWVKIGSIIPSIFSVIWAFLALLAFVQYLIHTLYPSWYYVPNKGIGLGLSSCFLIVGIFLSFFSIKKYRYGNTPGIKESLIEFDKKYMEYYSSVANEVNNCFKKNDLSNVNSTPDYYGIVQIIGNYLPEINILQEFEELLLDKTASCNNNLST